MTGYSEAVRNVLPSLKDAVYAEYGVTSRTPFGMKGSYEIDHLIPLELGGNNQITNLWPEAYPGFLNKDVIENRMHRSVCAGELTLREAQTYMRRHYTRR